MTKETKTAHNDTKIALTAGCQTNCRPSATPPQGEDLEVTSSYHCEPPSVLSLLHACPDLFHFEKSQAHHITELLPRGCSRNGALADTLCRSKATHRDKHQMSGMPRASHSCRISSGQMLACISPMWALWSITIHRRL